MIFYFMVVISLLENISACVTSASGLMIQAPPVLANWDGAIITRYERETGENKMEENTGYEIIPNNTISDGVHECDSQELIEFYRQETEKGEFTESDLMDMLEVAYRWGYKAGNKDTARNCYTPLRAYTTSNDSGDLSLMFEDYDGSECEHFYTFATEPATKNDFKE